MEKSRDSAIETCDVVGLIIKVSDAMPSLASVTSLEGNYRVDATIGLRDGVPCYAHESCRHYTITRRDGRWWLDSKHGGHPYFCVASMSSVPPSGRWKNSEGCQGYGNLNLAILVKVQGIIHGRKRNQDDVIQIQERVWKEKKFTDAEIVCDGQRMPVHRATLSAASSVFEAAFSSSLSEGRSAVYEIRESCPEAVDAMLRYIYTGEVDAVDTAWVPLLDLAVQYQLDNLVKQASVCLLDGLSADNVKVRAAALKRYQQHTAVGHTLKRFCDALRMDEHNDLLLALM